MRHFLRKSLLHLQPSKPTFLGPSLRHAHRKAQKQPPKSPPPPTPPKPPKKAEKMTAPHDETWEDQYSWMSKLNDKVAMRHMDVYMEQEEKYTEAVLSETQNLQSKLQSEIASRLPVEDRFKAWSKRKVDAAPVVEFSPRPQCRTRQKVEVLEEQRPRPRWLATPLWK